VRTDEEEDGGGGGGDRARGMKMCVRPGSESPAEELDEALWMLFRIWKAYGSGSYREANSEDPDLISTR
jgi:hypothetical protein